MTPYIKELSKLIFFHIFFRYSFNKQSITAVKFSLCLPPTFHTPDFSAFSSFDMRKPCLYSDSPDLMPGSLPDFSLSQVDTGAKAQQGQFTQICIWLLLIPIEHRQQAVCLHIPHSPASPVEGARRFGQQKRREGVDLGGTLQLIPGQPQPLPLFIQRKPSENGSVVHMTLVSPRVVFQDQC